MPFLLAAASGVSFAVSYGLDLPTPALGVTIGGSCLFLAIGLTMWGKLLEAAEPTYVEERAVSPSPRREMEAFRAALTEQPIPRARVLWGAFGFALACMGAAVLFPLRSLFAEEGGNPDRILAHTRYRRGTPLVTEDGRRVRPADLDIGGVETVFAQHDDLEIANTMTLLIKVPPNQLELPQGQRGWAVDGVVAFSRLCTHAGCPVGLYADEYHLLMCPCHHSIFDVLTGAQVVSGPAPRPLPQLPLGLDDEGYLIALGDFPQPVGPGYWGFFS